MGHVVTPKIVKEHEVESHENKSTTEPACGTCNGACPCEQPKKIVVHIPVKQDCGCKVCPCTSETAPTHTLSDHLNATNPTPKCGTCNGECPCPTSATIGVTGTAEVEEKTKCGCKVCPCVVEEKAKCGTCNGLCPCVKPKPPPPVPKCGTCNGGCPCEEKVVRPTCGCNVCPCVEEKPKCGTCNGLCPCEEKVEVDVVKPEDEENKPKSDDGDFDIVSVVHLKPVKLKDFNEDVFEETIARALKVERNTVDVVLKTVKKCVHRCDGGGILVPFKVTTFTKGEAQELLYHMKRLNFVNIFAGSRFQVGEGSKYHKMPEIDVKGATKDEEKMEEEEEEKKKKKKEAMTGNDDDDDDDDDDVPAPKKKVKKAEAASGAAGSAASGAAASGAASGAAASGAASGAAA